MVRPAPLLILTLLLALPGAGRAENDYRHVIAPGDTLIDIAQRMLRQPSRWPVLQRHNGIADPHRLRPGSTLRIPVSLLRPEPVVAHVTDLHGDARADQQPLAAGRTIAQGQILTTAEQSFVTVELVDGSRLTLQPGSRLRIEELARLRGTTVPQTRLELLSGRIESAVAKLVGPRPHYVVKTSGATIGVRGTRFRVATADQAQTEVTDGSVAVGGARRTTVLREGQGLLIAANGEPGTARNLLPPPTLDGLPALQERIVLRLAFPAIAGAAGYRVQVASGSSFTTPIAEARTAQPEAKFADLADGDYTVRVRAVDPLGLEGRDADFSFRLKARPEPPFLTSPPAGAKLRGDSAEFAWAKAPEAAGYRIQLARDAGFAQLLADVDALRSESFRPAATLAEGDYFWRVRSLRSDGDAGPWSDSQHFLLRPAPAAPLAPAISERALDFSWPSEPGQTFLFQLARDEAFADIVVALDLDVPSVSIPRPPAGTYYMRVRAVDADGFIGPFTGTQRITVPLPPVWWLLLPLLPALI